MIVGNRDWLANKRAIKKKIIDFGATIRKKLLTPLK